MQYAKYVIATVAIIMRDGFSVYFVHQLMHSPFFWLTMVYVRNQKRQATCH